MQILIFLIFNLTTIADNIIVSLLRKYEYMKIVNKEIFEIHADLCQVLANNKRLMILTLLARKEMNVGEIVEVLKARKANISQHLRVLREKHLVKSRRDGQTIYYSLVDRRLIKACNLIRSILLDGMKKQGKIAKEIDPESLIVE